MVGQAQKPVRLERKVYTVLDLTTRVTDLAGGLTKVIGGRLS